MTDSSGREVTDPVTSSDFSTRSHDPLCPSTAAYTYSAVATVQGVAQPVDVTVRSKPCQCALVAKVRADERGQTCHRGCRDGLVRVLSFDGEEAEVDVCPCSR